MAATQTKRRGRPKVTPPNRHDVKRRRPKRPQPQSVPNPCVLCGREPRKPGAYRCKSCASRETGPSRDAERVARQLARQGGKPLPMLGDLLPGTWESIELERQERMSREHLGA